MAGGDGEVAKLVDKLVDKLIDWQVSDPVHGLMEFPGLIRKIVDTRIFQRLRIIRQLGGSFYVYPAADHSRFAHSLGVAYLALQTVQRLRYKSHPYGKVSHSNWSIRIKLYKMTNKSFMIIFCIRALLLSTV